MIEKGDLIIYGTMMGIVDEVNGETVLMLPEFDFNGCVDSDLLIPLSQVVKVSLLLP